MAEILTLNEFLVQCLCGWTTLTLFFYQLHLSPATPPHTPLTRTASQPAISLLTFTLAFTWYESWKGVFCRCRWSWDLHGGRKVLGLGHDSFSLGSQILLLALPLQIPPGSLSRAWGAPVNASGSSSPGCKLCTANIRTVLYGVACIEFQSQSSFSVQNIFSFQFTF